MPRRLHGHGILLFVLLVLLRPAAANTLSTFAMSQAESTTIVCALLPSAASPLLVDLNCTEAGGDHERQETYPSSHPFSALAGGDHFLCAVGPSAVRTDAVAMRWWDLSKNRTDAPGTNGTGDGRGKSKRVYLGRPIQALSSGGYRVCGVLSGGELHCWRWRGLKIPEGLRFVSVAVGDWFVCAIEKGPPTPIRCFGNDTEAVNTVPTGGSFDVVAAHGRRACALSTDGALSCWGNGAPALNGVDAATTGYAALALGKDGVCGLRTNGTISCFGDGVASPPDSLAGAQYIEVQAHDRVFCGVLMVNYSLVCWGGHEFNETNRLVFDRVLPGPCELMSACKCGVLAGSANLCDAGRCICKGCAFEFNIATPKAALSPGGKSRNRRRIIWVAVAVAAGAFLVMLVALQFALLLWCRRRRRSRRRHGQELHGHGAGLSLMPPRIGSSKGPGSVVEHFTLEVLHAATDGFTDERRIGSGSFGSVYRGTLTDGREVAIKRAEDQAKPSSSAGRPARRRDREAAFNSELTALARANHKNIRYAESVTPKNVVEFAVPHILNDEVSLVLDLRLPAPTPHEADALSYVGYLAADCVGPVGRDRPSMTEVVNALERALAVCTAAPLSRSGTARRVLSRSGTDQFDLTDTD
ncbi:hypothetical protein ABZP36_009027 [Zizania latifolia]